MKKDQKVNIWNSGQQDRLLEKYIDDLIEKIQAAAPSNQESIVDSELRELFDESILSKIEL